VVGSDDGSGGQPHEARHEFSAKSASGPLTVQRGSGSSSTQSQFFEGSPFLNHSGLFTQSGSSVGSSVAAAGAGDGAYKSVGSSVMTAGAAVGSAVVGVGVGAYTGGATAGAAVGT